MNSSQIAKRTIPVLIIVLVIIGAAVLASVLKKEKLAPNISNPDSVYLSTTEDGRTYDILNSFMYEELKNNVGLETILKKVDKYLLEKLIKEDGKSYYEFITEEEIEEAIDEAAFKSGKEDLTEDEIEEGYEDYYNAMYISSGLRTKEAVADYHRLELARKLFGSDKLHEEIEEADRKAENDSTELPYFKESQYEAKHKADYLSSYWAIIIPFKSAKAAEHALAQVGLKADLDSKSGNYSNLVWIDSEERATANEIALAFIEMYNTFYSSYTGDYPNSRLTLIEDEHYRYNEDGFIEFNKVFSEDNEVLNELYFENKDVAAISAQVENFLKGMLSYTTNSNENKFYTAEPRAYDNKLFVYMFKIAVEPAKELEAVREEIFESLFEKALTDTFVNQKLIELREENKFEIFDPEIEEEYLSLTTVYDFEFDKTKNSNDKLVAKIDGLEISADDLFSSMDTHFGLSLVASELNYLRFLNNSTLNKIYDYYTPNLKVNERILDKEKWEEIRNTTINEKNIFLMGGYQQFPPSYGWKNFLRDYYGVSDVEELMYSILYRKLRSDYAQALVDIEELTEEDATWLEILAYMEKARDEYFSINGVQALIAVKDREGNYVPEEDWTQLQKDYAEELYDNIWLYIGAEEGTYENIITKLVKEFNEAPRFLASKDQELVDQPELDGNPYVLEEDGVYSIEVSKYKTAGLTLEFLSLGGITNTTTASKTMPEALLDAAKEVFNILNAEEEDREYRYGYTLGSTTNEYLISETGYHVYINTSITRAATWTYEEDGEKFILPTLQMIQTNYTDNAAEYLLDENGDPTEIEFTSAMKAAISKYFNPIKDEIIGSTNVLIKLYEELKDLTVAPNNGNYSESDFDLFLEKLINVYKENLTYIKADE